MSEAVRLGGVTVVSPTERADARPVRAEGLLALPAHARIRHLLDLAGTLARQTDRQTIH